MQTIDLLRETTGIFEKEIPALRQQVAAAEKRTDQLERNKFRRGRSCVWRGLQHGADGDGGCSKSAAAGRSKLPWGKVGQDRTQRQMYLPSARPGGWVGGIVRIVQLCVSLVGGKHMDEHSNRSFGSADVVLGADVGCGADVVFVLQK